MKQIRFKPDCVRWICEGKKTTTFRAKSHEGEYEIVGGSWFNAIKLGIKIKLAPIKQMGWLEMAWAHYKTEGDFESLLEFRDWLLNVDLLGKIPRVGWLHKIELIKGVT